MRRFSRTLGGLAIASLTALTLTAPAASAAPAKSATPDRQQPNKPRADFTSFDDRVIFQSFSLYQPYEKTMWDTLAGKTEQLNSWGVTDVWLPPAYRSFSMARYMEGYAISDRYDLGSYPQGPNGETATKYGTAEQLQSLVGQLHRSNLKAQMDLVPNQMMGLEGREAVTATRADGSGNPYYDHSGKRTPFVDKIYLPYTKGGGKGQAEHGAIKEFNKSHWNGSSLQQIGYGDALTDKNGKPYRIDQKNAADNNAPAWMSDNLVNKWGHNTIEGYLSSRDAYELSPGNWRPYLVNDPDFVKYATAECGFADENAVRTGEGAKSIWSCRDAFIDRLQDYKKHPLAVPGIKYNFWGEQPSLFNGDSGMDGADQMRFAGHTVNKGIGGRDEFLVGNDFDNSKKEVQDEQRNWMKWLLDTYKFDGFRVDAASHFDTKVLDIAAEETAKKFNYDPQHFNYLESYMEPEQNAYTDRTGNQQLALDGTLFRTMNDSLSGGAPLGNMWRNSAANVTGNRADGGTYRPNWSFTNNHDQEKYRINTLYIRQLGLPQGGCDNVPNCRSFDAEWTKAGEDKALEQWNADLVKPSSQKQVTPKNMVSKYAVMLTNKATTPTVYYGDMYRTNGKYMAEKTPYFDEIETLLKARKSFAKGEQKTYDFGPQTTASVRLGADRATGLATVISKDPKVNTSVTVDMGRDHANQAYRDVLGKSTQTLITDGEGKLLVPVRGSENTPEVSGYLGVWAPAGTQPTYLVRGAIGDKHQSLNGEVGGPVTGEICGLRDRGCLQHFEKGSIYWSPATGAHFVRGAIRDRWAQLGWENGFLGFPTSDEFCGLRGGGCGQHFKGGSLYWSPASGVHFVTGLIRDRWSAGGWENGPLMYPTTDEFCRLRDGGCGQQFQGGSIYWSPRSGAQQVFGAIRDAYAAQGWENGRLGYPTDGERCSSGGCVQNFQYGRIEWNPRTGARVI